MQRYVTGITIFLFLISFPVICYYAGRWVSRDIKDTGNKIIEIKEEVKIEMPPSHQLETNTKKWRWIHIDSGYKSPEYDSKKDAIETAWRHFTVVKEMEVYKKLVWKKVID